MLRSTRRPSPALVVGIIALIAAMGGSAVAANKITSKDIKNNTIKGKDIKRGGVKPSDLSAKAKATLQGAQGAQGVQGIQGPKGDPGETGPVGPSHAYVFPGPDEHFITGAGERTVISEELPVGTYHVMARAAIQSQDEGISPACTLRRLDGFVSADSLAWEPSEILTDEVVTLVGTLEIVEEGDKIELLCFENDVDNQLRVTDSRISAILVGAAN